MDEAQTPLEQFAYNLHQEVLVKCSDDADPQLREEAFTEVVLEFLAEYNETDSAEPCYWNARGVGRTPAAKINAWSLSGDGATLDLFVVLYLGEATSDFVPKSAMEQHFKQARSFLLRALDGFHEKVEESNPVFHAMRSIYEARDNLTTIRLFFLTDGVVKSAKVEEEQLPGYELRYVFWDLVKLSRLTTTGPEVIELNFVRDYGGAVPALLTADATGEYRTFLAYLPAPMLARIYGEHGQRLLERNVRAYLGKGKNVNKGMLKTLREEPHRFLAYNNGLCCTAANVDMEPGKDGHVRLKSVRDFQIVNGGQTTASIYHALRKDKFDVSSVMVQVKLTVLNNPARVAEIVPLISIYANSQNKVNAADFSANGAYHHQLEQMSRSMWAPTRGGLERATQWYYERARGSYMDDLMRRGTPARMRQWAEERPKEHKFTKTDVAKFEHAWAGLPHLVVKGGDKNFIEFAKLQEEEGAPIVNAHYFQHLVAKAILWKTSETIFKSLDLPQIGFDTVAYTLSWLAVKTNYRLNLSRIWSDQQVPLGHCEAIKLVLPAAHRHLKTSPLNSIPREAAKKEECWKDFRALVINLPDLLLQELSDDPNTNPKSEHEIISTEWERVRHAFINDNRTIEGLEVYTGQEWIKKFRRHSVASFASLTWDELKLMQGIGFRKAKALVEMLVRASA